MRLLAADTSGTAASVCVLDGTRVLATRFVHPEETHSRHLLSMIQEALADSGLGLQDLQALVTTIGPGSFTGVRIGVSTLKGLAMAQHLPLLGVSTLEVLAARFMAFPQPVCVMLDARRKEVYTQLFRVSGKSPEALGEPMAADPRRIVADLDGSVLFAGSGALAYREEILAEMGERALWPGLLSHDPDAREAAFLALLQGLDAARPASRILPLYLRQSDAELQWIRKNGEESGVQA